MGLDQSSMTGPVAIKPISTSQARLCSASFCVFGKHYPVLTSRNSNPHLGMARVVPVAQLRTEISHIADDASRITPERGQIILMTDGHFIIAGARKGMREYV